MSEWGCEARRATCCQEALRAVKRLLIRRVDTLLKAHADRDTVTVDALSVTPYLP